MEKMKKEIFTMPEPRANVRDGEAVVEFVQSGEVVGEFNVSKVVKNWFDAFKRSHKQSLKVVK